MTVYLLRHARAGRRSAWTGDDDLRPLTRVGRRQAAGIVDDLASARITRIVSSPYVRCRQSVEPIAQRLRLPVDLADGLAEGADLHEVLRVLEKVSDTTTVLCTHGDVIELLLDHLRREGVDIGKRRGRPLMEKSSMWVLQTKRGRVTSATYRPPPRPPQ
jgi:phosphohistidine phosphatase SixA